MLKRMLLAIAMLLIGGNALALAGKAQAILETVSSCNQNEIVQEKVAVQDTELQLAVNGTALHVIWEDNEAVEALRNAAAQTPIIVHTSLYGGFEQVGSLPQVFPRHDTPITTRPGDIMLFSGDQLVVFFGENHWSYTPLGHISDKTDEDLASLLGGDTAVIEIRLN